MEAGMCQMGQNLPERAYLVNMKGKAKGEETLFLIRFLQPSEIRGIGVLLRRTGPCSTEELIYLPYVKRIISFSKDGDQPSLVQTDFEPEDLGNPHLFWKSKKFLRQETVDGRPSYVYESFPDSHRCSQYKKVRSWVDVERFVPLQLLK